MLLETCVTPQVRNEHGFCVTCSDDVGLSHLPTSACNDRCPAAAAAKHAHSAWGAPCAQSALIARGRSNRQAKLLFYGKLAEKALGTYERDGWGEFPTQVGCTHRLGFASLVIGSGFSLSLGPETSLLCVDSSKSGAKKQVKHNKPTCRCCRD